MARDGDGDVDEVDESGVAACTAVAIWKRTVYRKGESSNGKRGGKEGYFDFPVPRVMPDFI